MAFVGLHSLDRSGLLAGWGEGERLNPAIDRCLSLLSKKPSKVRSYGKQRLGGRPNEYPSIPFWTKWYGDEYYFQRIAVRDDKYIEILEDKALPDLRYRDPIPKEARLIAKRYLGKVAQMVVDDCLGVKNSCRYALWYPFKDDAVKSKSRTPPKNNEERIERHKQFLKSLPQQIRSCHPTVKEFKKKLILLEEIRKEYERVEAATTDWSEVESLTEPVLETIGKFYPDIESISSGEQRYLMKTIYLGMKIGVSDEELLGIADDLSRQHRRKKVMRPQSFVVAMKMVVDLMLAKILHLEHRKKTGVGISRDFVKFVNSSIRNIRYGRLTFRVLPRFLWNRASAGIYDKDYNIFYLYDVPNFMLNHASQFKTRIHEAVHGYDDWRMLTSTRVQTEIHADDKGFKSKFLYKKWLGRDYDEIERTLRILQEKFVDLLIYDMERMMRCLGSSGRVVDWGRIGGMRSKLWDEFQEVFKEELGAVVHQHVNPHAHIALGERNARLIIWSGLRRALKRSSVLIGRHLENGGKEVVEDIMISSCSAFRHLRDRLTNKRLSKKTSAYKMYPLFKHWAVMQSSILYLKPNALPQFNEIMEKHHISFILDKLWELPEYNDGL